MKKTKPLIGVTPMYDSDNEKWWIQLPYMLHLEANGAIPVIIPPTENLEILEDVFHKVDGILLTGGQDVSPCRYGEERHPACGISIEIRDTIDFFLTAKSVEHDKPLFGICRGMQVINTACGGTLYQDIKAMTGSSTNHLPGLPHPDSIAHDIIFNEKSPTLQMLGKQSLPVNSFHHQAVKRPGPGIEITANAPDGTAEALVLSGRKFIRAVQWHPERFSTDDILSKTLFSSFISACN